MDKSRYLDEVEMLLADPNFTGTREDAFYEVSQMLIKKAQEKYHAISGLWRPTDRDGNVISESKVAFSGRAEEDLEIPAGAKIIAFKSDSEHEKAPVYNLVWTRD